MIKKLIKKAVGKLGYRIILKKESAWPADNEWVIHAESLIKQVRPHTMVAHEGLLSLYRQARYCEEQQLKGAFVECGVWKGGAVGLMALVNLTFGQERRNIHLFDAFEEICEPDESVDGRRAVEEVKAFTQARKVTGKLVPLKGIYDRKGGPGTVEDNRKLLIHHIGYQSDYLHFHKGWFQHTLPEVHSKIPEIALLRIDSDWYASTKICLDYLFDRVVPGGFVIIDDYGAYEGCKKAVDEFLESKPEKRYLHYVNEDIRYLQL